MTTELERIAYLESRVAMLETQVTALLNRPNYWPVPYWPQYPQAPWQQPWYVGSPYVSSAGGTMP